MFDEIDAGIGGQTAHAVGETLRRLPSGRRSITITHLPQIASLADRHFRVEKTPGDPTHTRIQPLDDAAAKRRAPADARRRGVHLGSAGGHVSFVELTGTARLGRRTKNPCGGSGREDLAIIEHQDLDRASPEEPLQSGVRVVVNVARSEDRPLPESGTAPPARGGVRPDRRTRGEALRRAWPTATT